MEELGGQDAPDGPQVTSLRQTLHRIWGSMSQNPEIDSLVQCMAGQPPLPVLAAVSEQGVRRRHQLGQESSSSSTSPTGSSPRLWAGLTLSGPWSTGPLTSCGSESPPGSSARGAGSHLISLFSSPFSRHLARGGPGQQLPGDRVSASLCTDTITPALSGSATITRPYSPN
ncbi:uncharacterized protein RBU57_017349 [Macrochelys suwanniensis]